MNRGDVVDVELPGLGRRPAVVCTRQAAIPFLANVTVVLVTTRIRELPTEVRVGCAEGLREESAINCDNLFTLSKQAVRGVRGGLDPRRFRELDDALRLALELEEPLRPGA